MYRLASDSAVKEFQQKIRDGQKENEELTSRLAKKERECEVKTEEQVTPINYYYYYYFVFLNIIIIIIFNTLGSKDPKG